MLCFSILYYIILYLILYYIVLYYIVLYYIMLYYVILYCSFRTLPLIPSVPRKVSSIDASAAEQLKTAVKRVATLGCKAAAAIVHLRWTPHPVIVTIGDNRDYIRVLLYSYYSTITGWGVLLMSTNCDYFPCAGA